MRKYAKRSICLLLTMIMLLTMLPATALAKAGGGRPGGGGPGGGSLDLSDVEISTIKFRIVNGTWSEALDLENVDANGDGIKDVRLSADGTEVIFQAFYWDTYEFFVYECEGPMESFMNAILGNDNTLGSTYIIPDTGFTLDGLSNQDWELLSGGISGSSADANSQMNTIKKDIHGYDDHMAPSGGFEEDTVYVLTLTKDMTETYDYTGAIDNGGMVTNSSQSHYYKDDSLTMVFTPADNYKITGVTVSVNKAEAISYEEYSGAAYVLGADGSFTFPAETVKHDVAVYVTTELKTYTVTWKNEDGTVLETDEGLVNGTTPEYNESIPVKTGNDQHSYEFIGWSPAVTAIDNENQVYTAVFAPVLNHYTVIWEDDDGTVLETDENVEYGILPTYDNAEGEGTTAELAAAKNTAEYTCRFAGWTPAVSPVTGDITYTATYTSTVNTYTVTWIDHNGSVLDTDEVYYGDTPSYSGTEPSRAPTSHYSYAFDGWEIISGELTNEGTVKEDVTYQAQYTSTEIGYTVTVKLYLDDVLADSADVHGDHIHPFLSADGGTTVYEGEDTDTGVFVAENVLNGTYMLYVEDGSDEYRKICDQVIVVENEDVEKACYYYTVTYDGDGADSQTVPETVAYHLGASVDIGGAPDRDGYTFKGWKDETSETVYRPDDLLTGSIDRTHTLVALWVKAVDVKVNVVLEHRVDPNDETKGIDPSSDKDEVTIELVWKPDGAGNAVPWDEVVDTVRNLTSDSTTHQYSSTPAEETDPEEIETSTYTADGATYTDIDGEDKQFSVTVTKPMYALDTSKGDNGSGITAQKDADGNWEITAYVKFVQNSSELEFSVEMDSSVPESAYPDAVIARVLYWDGDSWEIITQQRGGLPGVRVNIGDDGEGSGSCTVWNTDGTSPYYYRFEVSAFVYGGEIVPYDKATSDFDSYTDGTYTATMQAVTNGEAPAESSYAGAYFALENENYVQKGTLHAVITVPVYTVTLDGNGGTFSGNATKDYTGLIKMPDVSRNVPVHSNNAYIFDGYNWYVDADKNGEADDSTVVSAVSAGTKLDNSYVLVAKWRTPWTVKGDITVDATYELGGETKIIQDPDRVDSVTVLLQYAPAGSNNFTNKQSVPVSIDYPADKTQPGTGSFEFTDVPNHGGTWRVRILNHNYDVTYKNETAAEFAPETSGLKGPSIAVDYDENMTAVVDAMMDFEPQLFELWYKVDATAIGDGFRPTSAEVLVLYDAGNDSDSPRDWPVISQMQDGSGGYDGDGVTLTNGIYEGSHSVWTHHPDGYLYDYAIEVEAVNGTDLNGSENFTVEYNGSAEYLNPGVYEDQTQLLIAKLQPKSYPIKYYLEFGSDIELTGMTVNSHKWSFDTSLKNGENWIDVPTRAGYVFTGWVNADDDLVTSIDANVQEETKLYATWVEDNWKDAERTPDESDSDSPTGGDGIPDSQQVLFDYVTDGHGTTRPLFEVVTLGGDYEEEEAVGNGAVPVPLPGYTYDCWEYLGSDNDSVVLSVGVDNMLVPTVNNADGGNTYSFKVRFTVDNWKDAERTPDESDADSPTGGDGIPDKYQVMVRYQAENGGSVSPAMEIVTLINAEEYVNTATVLAKGSTATADTDYAFDGWSNGYGNVQFTETLAETGAITISDARGGDVYTFTASFAEDIKGDPQNGGDGTADKYQVFVEFLSANVAAGTVTGDGVYQTVTFDNNAVSGAVTPSLANVVVTAADGYAFDVWKNQSGAVVVPTATVENVPGNTTLRYYANFAPDVLNDSDDDTDGPGDNIPDKYQATVTYQVEFGYWDSAKNDADKKVVFTLYERDQATGQWKHVVPYPSLGDTIPTGMIPDEDHFDTGTWSADITKDTYVAGNAVYVYTFGDIGDYSVEHYKAGADGTYPAQPTESESFSKSIGSVVTATPKTYEGYCLNLQATGTVQSGTITTQEQVVLKLYYDVDVVGGGNNGGESDEIPDKYQKKVTFKVVNGQWSDSTAEEKITYVTLKTSDLWDESGSGTLSAPGVGDKPASGYKAGSWDATPPTTVTGMNDATYTYTYARNMTPINPGETVNYIVEHYKADANGAYPADPTEKETLGGKIGETVTAVAKDYSGYCVNMQAAGTVSSKTLVKVESAADIVVLKLYYDIDVVGGGNNGGKSDESPDKYQKKVTFKVVNGQWSDSTAEDKITYVTLKANGLWDESGSGSLSAPGVGDKPASGYKAGSWDTTPPATVSGTENGLYTYTYKAVSNPSTPPVVSSFGSVTLTKVDSADPNTTLANVVFELYKANGTLEGTYKTGADGTITVNNLLAGEHYWIEVRPAEGYMLDTSKHTFRVSGGKTTKVNISNTRTPVPDAFSGDHYAYVIGYSDGLVHPEANITRAEVATIFFRLLDDSTREKYLTKENSFSDVQQGMWFNTAVSTMAAMGIVTGYPDGNFHPNDYITRAEFAVIAARFDSNGNTTGVSFDDIYGHWAQKEINQAYNNGWILGYEDGTFKPNQNIIRAEAMALINRVLQRVPEHKDDLLDNMVQWPDNADTTKWYYLAIQEATNSHDYNRKTNGYEHWTGLREIRDWAALEQ